MENRNIIYTICSPNFHPVLSETINNMSLYALQHNADFKVVNVTGNSHIEKYLDLEQIHGYEKILYLDADIYISPGSPNVFDLVGFLGAMPSVVVKYKEMMTELALPIFPQFDNRYYVNGGLLIGNEMIFKSFANKVVEFWDKYDAGTCDQTYICEVLRRLYPDFTRLNKSWNHPIMLDIKAEDFYFGHALRKTIPKKVEQVKLAKRVKNDCQ